MNLEKAKLINGYILDPELEWLASTARKSTAILELGAFLGKSTRVLCDNTKGTVCSIDLWEQTEGGLIATFPEVYKEFIDNLRDHLIAQKLSFYKATTDYAISLLKNEGRKFDFIFIDADHRYDAVWADLNHWWPKVKNGGICAGHDYWEDSIAKNLDIEFQGVDNAVQDFFVRDLKLSVETSDISWIVYK